MMDLSRANEGRGDGAVVAHRNPQQRRSQAAYERVMAAARRLTSDRNFDAISIRDLAAAGQCSVGSFYYRFGTKEAFFDLLIEDMVERRKIGVEQTLRNNPIDRLPEALARGALDNHRAHAGLLRSIIKKHLEGDPKWDRVSAMGRYAIARFGAAVEAHRGVPLSELQQERVTFAFVWLYGLLAHSILELNTVFGMETMFFEEEAVQAFKQAIEHALSDDPQPVPSSLRMI